jgi:hypothetical protein
MCARTHAKMCLYGQSNNLINNDLAQLQAPAARTIRDAQLTCMYVCIYVCMYACVTTHMYVCMRDDSHLCMQVCDSARGTISDNDIYLNKLAGNSCSILDTRHCTRLLLPLSLCISARAKAFSKHAQSMIVFNFETAALD